MSTNQIHHRQHSCAVVFHPDWWNKHYETKFNEDYFFDPASRVKAEQRHRQILFERFGDIGMGEKNAVLRPVIGPVHLAAGFMISSILGCRLEFYDDKPPEVIPANISEEEAWALKVPDIHNTYPMNKLLSLMEALDEEYGYLEGDFNWQGLLNVALDLRGQAFLMDYYTNPELVKHLRDVIFETTVQAVNLVRSRTKSSSISVNRVVGIVDTTINLHSNCSVTMISKETYYEFHLPYEKRLAKKLRPYGIHHCGNDMHKVSASYAKTNAILYDVGWGSDIAFCRKNLPASVFSIRIDPVKMNSWTTIELEDEVHRCVKASGALDKTVLCCVNIDANVPDKNVRTLFTLAKELKLGI